jgi:hypothetical protein
VIHDTGLCTREIERTRDLVPSAGVALRDGGSSSGAIVLVEERLPPILTIFHRQHAGRVVADLLRGAVGFVVDG